MTRTKDQILRDLDPKRPETFQALIDFHRQTLGGFVMEADGDDKGSDDDKGTGGSDDGGDDAKGKSGGGGNDDDASKKGADESDEKDLGEAGKKAIRAEREARKALEKKLNDFQTAQANQAKELAKALGIETKDATSSDDVIETLRTEVTELRLNHLVDTIARETKVTDRDDIALIRGAGNEDAMRKLAARLAPKDGDGKSDDAGDDEGEKKRRPPRQDKSQGKGGAGQEKSGLEAGKAEARRRFPSKR